MTLIGFAAPASAALLTFDTRAAFNAAAPGLPVEDFEEGNIGAGGIAGFDDPLDSSTNNTFFAPGDILTGLTLEASTEEGGDLFILGAGFDLDPSIVVGANFFEASLDLLFSGASAIGLDIGSALDDSTVTVSVFGPGDLLLNTFNVAATGTGTFFGVINDSGTISRINLLAFSTTDQAEWVDNVAFGAAPASPSPVPEPATLSLLGIGLAGAAVRRRDVVSRRDRIEDQQRARFTAGLFSLSACQRAPARKRDSTGPRISRYTPTTANASATPAMVSST